MEPTAFRTECLRPYVPASEPHGVPFYERYGDEQVTAGKYRDVIRYRQHVAPIKHALWKYAGLSLV